MSKTFDGIRVLHDVTLTVRSGEILGLIGENGSGKSTLIKILSGYHSADPGGRVVLGRGAFIHQDLALVPSMTVLENLRIARFDTGFGWRIRWSRERAHVRKYLTQVGLDVHPDTPVGRLSITERALVAVARGLADLDADDSHRLLVLDEPTAYLPNDGVQRLFEVLRALSADGAAVVFVSHRLDEVRELCDRVAVLRGGELVDVVDASGATERDLLQLMLGRPVDELYPDTPDPEGSPLLEVAGLSGSTLLDLSFTARPGEIIGFAGLPGSGYDEVPYLLTGARRARSGTMRFSGDSHPLPSMRPRVAIGLGMALLPADRARTGCAPALTVRENMTLPSLSSFTWLRSIVLRGKERRAALAQASRFGVTPERPESALRFLSGGNQQKVMLAKWMLVEPRVLLLHEPTQGVDVGAKHDIFAHLSSAAATGAVVLLSTVEHEDLARLCSRVYVMHGGRCRRVIHQDDLTPGRLAEAVYSA